jgi:hypothetical protein
MLIADHPIRRTIVDIEVLGELAEETWPYEINVACAGGFRYGDLFPLLGQEQVPTTHPVELTIEGSHQWSYIPKIVDSLTGWESLEILQTCTE